MNESNEFWVLTFSAAILLVFVFLVLVFWLGRWLSDHGQGKSPYTGLPLRPATDLSYYAAEKTLRFLYDMQQYDNRIFSLRKAAFCRETGRVFQDCVTWYGATLVDWNFLQNRYPGSYVSWGSLNRDQQAAVRQRHFSLEGYQTEISSPTASPRAVESEYAFTKPGPLYVDLETNVLLGWKSVPGTETEVLVVQKPVK